MEEALATIEMKKRDEAISHLKPLGERVRKATLWGWKLAKRLRDRRVVEGRLSGSKSTWLSARSIRPAIRSGPLPILVARS
jgi:hypothetical protein